MTNTPIEAINVEPRLLCGPGPANISPDVLAALSKPLLGHLDPDMFEILTELAAMTARVYQRDEGDGVTLPISATGTSGMEAGIAALVEPGSTVIIGVNGYFGRRLVEIASRYHANVVEVEADWGQAVTNEALLEALAANPDARLMAVVHAETSSGVRHDLAELGAAMKDNDTFLMADCVTSLGGIEVALSDWGVDYAYSCTQKCLAMSPGMSPISISQRAVDFMRSQPKPNTFYLDPQLLEAYWLTRPPAYHHTLPSPLVFGLHEALREVLNEGLEARWARHAEAGAYLQAAMAERSMALLADPAHQLPQLTAVLVPEGIDGAGVQKQMLREHGIEIGGGLPGAPAMWRFGLMGYNANIATADKVLAAFDAVMADAPTLAAA
jgi:alanine-glyoxylate transaminase/serine-glyoxylate transaminase/serine-pyruvate transaminase